jgi:hypothetical protein
LFLFCDLFRQIDCARLPREAMFVALPRKIDTMLPRELGACRAKSERFFAPRQRDFSVLFFRGVHQRPHAAAALRCWTGTRLLTHKQTNEFAAHEQLRAAAARNRYPS